MRINTNHPKKEEKKKPSLDKIQWLARTGVICPQKNKQKKNRQQTSPYFSCGWRGECLFVLILFATYTIATTSLPTWILSNRSNILTGVPAMSMLARSLNFALVCVLLFICRPQLQIIFMQLFLTYSLLVVPTFRCWASVQHTCFSSNRKYCISKRPINSKYFYQDPLSAKGLVYLIS